VFTLEYYPGPSGGCFLSSRLKRVEWGQLPPLPPGVDADVVKQYVTEVVDAMPPTTAVPFNFAGALGDGPTRIENAGVTIDAQLRRVVFRVAPRGADSGSDVRWTNFHRGAIADHLGGRQWAFLADSGILEGRHTAEIARAIRESAPAEPPCTSAESR
jgi:hypothetical protein